MIPFWLLVVIAGCGLCLWMPAVQALQPSASLHKNTFRTLPLYNSILDRLQDKLLPSISKRRQKGDVKKTEAEELVDFVDYKPWRAPKVKYLTYHYRPFEDSWMERFHNVSDDTINIYSTAYDRTSLDGFRLDEVWSFPWVWTRVKAERMGWIYKHFERNLETMTVQEHMELESFFSEFDMPYRWGLARVREVDLINMAAISLAFFTQIHGIKPTDLGLRPDEQVRTCPVQFHNCISSTNDPSDADHFAPPFRWTRSKSPDQVLPCLLSSLFLLNLSHNHLIYRLSMKSKKYT